MPKQSNDVVSMAGKDRECHYQSPMPNASLSVDEVHEGENDTNVNVPVHEGKPKDQDVVKLFDELDEEYDYGSTDDGSSNSISDGSDSSDVREKLTPKHIILVVEMFLITLAVSYTEVCIVPAFPLMSEQWSDHAEFVPWVLSAFNMIGAISTPILGYFASVYGPKYPVMVSFTVYSIGQLGCAFSNNVFMMIAFRAVQGIGMAVYVLFYSAVKVTIPKRYVPIVIGILETNVSVGTAVGLVGGSLTMDNVSRWQTVFWTTLPVVVIFGIAFIFTFTDEENKKASIPDKSSIPPFDFVGPVLLTIGLVLFLASFTFSDTRGWDKLVISFIVVGLVFLFIFGVYEMMIDHPLIPVKYVLTKDIGMVMIVSFSLGVVALSVIQITPYLLLSPESTIISNKKMVFAGLLMLPFGVVELIVAPIVGSIGRYVGFPICMSLGAFLQCASLIYLSFLHHHIAAILIGFILYGGTSGTIYVASMNMISDLVSPQVFSVLSGTYLLFNVMGSAVGPVVVDLISRKDMYYGSDASSSFEPVYASDKGYTHAFYFIVAAAALEFVSSLFVSNKFMYCRKKMMGDELEKEGEKFYEVHTGKVDDKQIEFDVVSV